MSISRVIERVQALAVNDKSVGSIVVLREGLNDIRCLQAWLDSLQSRLVATMSELNSVMPEVELIRESGLSTSDVRKVMARTETIGSVPVFGDALAEGNVTSAHLDALSSGLKILGEQSNKLIERAPELLVTAQTMTADEFTKFVRRTAQALTDDGGVGRFEKQRRQTFLRHWVDADGMTNLFGKFDPERGSIVASLLDAGVEAMFHSGDREVPVECDASVEPNDHRRALAMVALLQSRPDGPTGSSLGGASCDRPARAEIVVHIDYELLAGAVGETVMGDARTCRTLNGSELTVETIRRLACEAEIIPLVLDGKSVPLDVGKSKRLATAYQRRALAAVHETCAIDGCSVKFSHCEPHHIDYWENGGVTDLNNLVPLCSRHHHAAHEGGWRLRLNPETRELLVQR
ncbi:unannotated protein [freshwater metagenome]|uniref:Unannotated protein n=1 Tax=freshwater metagenome TaxID=449393 RepID=A0A6J7SAG0_9ZZZZ|nr:DUF222 domain-containing protein [Actinomycetota bacterium]MSX16626.1 DUF222 domain-containing protein [Actinomycetota bacterium]MSX78289.1 DUF222 domain-containing protein [Actinomycetota bacterium]MSZ72671.1 DUF222 domain-containing protein [Actinomycetota bacterium]MUH57112.1 DUF222 domain-containing protein [Actinomycetota bacterium]